MAVADYIGNRVKVLLKEYNGGAVVEDASPDLVQADWMYKRHGGLEAFNVVLARDSRQLPSISCPVVEIWLKNGSTEWVMVCSGIVQHMMPMIDAGKTPILTLCCVGYLQQLMTARFSNTYDSDDIDTIVEDIIDTQIASDVDITRWSAKTTAGSGVNLTRFEFDGYAYNAIASLAEKIGTVAWGVMPVEISGTWYPAKFYFVDEETTTVNNNYWVDEMFNVEFDYDISRIKNHLIMRGDIQNDDGDVLDTTDSDATSQTTYGKRVEVIDNPLVDNASDAADYLSEVLTALKVPGNAFGFALKNKRVADRVERNIPFGIAHVWDVLDYANDVDWYINSVNYVLRRDGSFDMYFALGDKLGVRRVYQPRQDVPGNQTMRNMAPVYGRGGYNALLNPNFNEIEWSKPGPNGFFYPKAWWEFNSKPRPKRGFV